MSLKSERLFQARIWDIRVKQQERKFDMLVFRNRAFVKEIVMSAIRERILPLAPMAR